MRRPAFFLFLVLVTIVATVVLALRPMPPGATAPGGAPLAVESTASPSPFATVSDRVGSPDVPQTITPAPSGAPLAEGIRSWVAPRFDPRSVVASAWAADTAPAHVAFRSWTERYLAAAPAEREVMEAVGLATVEARRVELARRIERDPEGALAAAVPLAVRTRLPAAVVARLEKRVSGPAELSLLAATPIAGGPPPAAPIFRSALIDGEEYRAHVYGRRATQATLPAAALFGIALDDAIAIADSPVRILEPGEVPAPTAPVLTCADCAAALADGVAPGAIAYQYAGRYGVAASAEHFVADASLLEAAERDQTEPPTAADNQPGTSTVVGRPSLSWTHGAKTVLVVRVDFSDLVGTPVSGGDPITEAAAVDLLRESGGVAEFFAASSYGKTSIVIRPAVNGDSPDVTGVLRLPKTAAFYSSNGANSTLHADARAAARTAGFDPDAYDRVCVVFSSLRDLPGNKLTYGGLASIIGSSIWVNGSFDFRVITHELGHTYGLFHANLWEFADGNPVSESGTSLEYGDPFDIMGDSFDATGDFGQWGKSILQWIPDTAVTVAETGGTFRVHRLDGVGADLSLPRALKIVREPGRDYWIGYRRATDSAAVDNGACVQWGYDTNRQGNILDLATPGDSEDEPVLPVGSTFDDTAAGITLRPAAQGGSGANEWIEIQVTLRPRVRWVASDIIADEQTGKATLLLRRSGNSAGALSVAYATESGGAVAGVDFTAASGVVSWSDGDTADKKVEILLTADTLVEGSESFSVRLGAVTGGVRTGPAVAVVTLGEPGARDTGFKADFINSAVARILPLPDGGILAGGYFSQLQDRSFTLFGYKRVARLKPNGTLDPEFNPGEGANGAVLALARQADGRFLVGGEFTTFAGSPAGRIVRLNPDGSVDTSFRVGTGAENAVQTIVALPDGRILVGGFFANFNGVARNRVVRLEPDGSIDSTYANPTYTASAIRDIAIQADGKVLLAGGFSYSGLPGPGVGFRSGVARFNPDGTRDATFDVGFGAHTFDKTNLTTTVYRVVPLPDGRVLVAGSFTGFGGLTGTTRRGVARLSATGAVDTAFAPAVQGNVFGLLALPDGSCLVGGDFTQVGADAVSRVARIRADGTTDTGFSAPGGFNSNVIDLARTAEGRVLSAGNGVALQGSADSRPIWRLLSGLPQPAGVVEFTSDQYSAGEGALLNLVVRRTGGSLGALRVGYAAARGKTDDSALAASDYTLAAGVLEWTDGDTASKAIPVDLLADGVVEAAESFTVRLGEALIGGATLGARQEAVVLIAPPTGGPQTITFESPADRILGAAPLTLSASASSGLPVNYTLVSGAATLAGAVLTPTGAGTVVVRATQPGGGSIFAAPPVERSFSVFTVELTNLAQTYAAVARPVGFTSSRADFAANITYGGASAAPREVGSYPVSLSSADPLIAGAVTGTLVIAKAPLTARPVDQVRMIGGNNAPLVVGYEGFVGGDTASVLDSAPVASTKAVKGSKPGDYPITLTGGADNNYTLTLAAGTLKVVTYAGAYETLLFAPGGGDPLGKVEVTVSATAPTFTGVLNLAEEVAPVPMTATPLALGAVEADGASGTWTSKAAAPKNYRVAVNLTATACLVDVYRGSTLIAEGAGPVVFVPPAKTAVAWAGNYTTWIDTFAARAEDDLRAAPLGAAASALKIPATGVATLAVTLPDGLSKVTGAHKPDATGAYRVFARPTAKRAPSYAAGLLSVDGAPLPFVWRKTARTGTPLDASYRAGFDLRGNATLRRWVAPNAASPLVSVLGLNASTGAFFASALGDGLGESAATLPGELRLSPSTNKVTLAATANPNAWTLAVTPATGAFSGGFTLTDLVPAAVAGKPAVKVVRKVVFTGALLAPRGSDADADVLGRGFFVVPPLTKGAEALSGEIQLKRPSAP